MPIIEKIRSLFSSPPKSSADAGRKAPLLNETQKLFCEWNAQRLGSSNQESLDRFLGSWNAMEDGHSGPQFRAFCDQSYQVYRVFFDDNPREIFDSYKHHSNMHFLRMLSYEDRTGNLDGELGHALSGISRPTIVDFGCGLAQVSRGLAKELKALGCDPQLFLADIPTLRKDFLIWLGEKTATSTTFLDCTKEEPRPKLPACDVFIATEVFEHLHDPLPYVNWMDNALRPGGVLITNICDHHTEFMHVSPKLEVVRSQLNRLKYISIKEYELYRKPSHRTAEQPDDL